LLSKYKSRYEARYSIRYRTQSPDPNLGVSINWSSWESRSWTQGVLTQSRAEIQSLRTGITSNQFQDHLLKKDQFVDDLFSLHHLPDQPVLSESRNLSKSCVVRLHTDRPGFSSQYFHVREQVTKFLLISYRKSDWKTRLIRDHNWPGSGSGSGSGSCIGITKIN
jgi:hypothetical protein